MGLLDEAIREHLELKRLRGVDPGDVAREEHDALGQVSAAQDDLDSAGSSGDGFEPTSKSQDTAEVDMQLVLDGEDDDIASQEATQGARETATSRGVAERDGQAQL